MLQQTQVSRVLGPYRRFVERFPTPDDCARAGAAEVVQAWAGLGYNRRALYLHRAAKAVADHHGGRVPAVLADLRGLPGVGDYTARAVAALAFGADVGAVDTNVARILARAVAGRSLGRAEAVDLADRLVPPGRSWEFTQAVFDLGALHCTSRGPACAGCPVRRSCLWARRGRPDPDPSVGSAATSRPQSRFDGSDRQGRGRLVAALRHGAIERRSVPTAAGWPDDAERSTRVACALVAEGFAHWEDDLLVPT
jgi:A/G-specific adenine glycosylase